MAKAIMVQGTMSNVGKSIITAGLCRVFRQDGYRVAPFKSQNMALNSFITREGLEMGRAQVVQAEACGIEPSVNMNPILLKPVTDMGSQVIVRGEVVGNMRATEYYELRKTLTPQIMEAYNALDREYDIIVIEGAGSPAEINLKRDDIVNMGMAKLAKAPVLLVGDIDRGGVFAQLYGTIELLDPDERAMVKATIVNKFRGNIDIFQPGVDILREKCGVPVAGVLPYIDIDIDDEDSLTERFSRGGGGEIDVAVVRLPRISNFSDFMSLEATHGFGVRYVSSPRELREPDIIILPGTKNTIADLKWLRESGLEAAVKKLAERGAVIFGICGGYQMLGSHIKDTVGAEGGGSIGGMNLLPVTTEFQTEKSRTRVTGTVSAEDGALPPVAGAAIDGYEIHMGTTTLTDGALPFALLDNGTVDGCFSGNVYGTYLHGVFDTADMRDRLLRAMLERKGITDFESRVFDLAEYKAAQYDTLAGAVRQSLDMELIYKILNAGV